jgi:hypothetical protein
MENSPRVVFERLFGDGTSAAQRRSRKQQDRASLIRSPRRWRACSASTPRSHAPLRVSRQRPRNRAVDQKAEQSATTLMPEASAFRSLEDHI